MNIRFFALLLPFFVSVVFAQPPSARKNYTLLYGNSIVAAKNYYLLTLLQEDRAAQQLLSADSVFSQLLLQKRVQLQTAIAECKNDVHCLATAAKFSDSEIAAVGARLRALYSNGNALGLLVQKQLVPAGTYILFDQLPAGEMLAKAWQQDAAGINFAIDVYAEGKKPNYPLIDSISFDVRLPGYGNMLYSLCQLVLKESSTSKLFFSPSLTMALRLLEINERNQAADFEPMTADENRAAAAQVKITDWGKYKYSLILVPGAGPELPSVALSAEGMIRCRLAALEYRQGLAPFIVLSGGKVHPFKTRYCEATEMKKFMVETLHLPASAIIIEPHARHTTTNMRNTVRLMFRYGIPFTKPALTCTTRGQSNMIEKTLPARCEKELHAIPYKNGQRLSETTLEFYPLLQALHINPFEPMDP
ncbi:MAG TPA: YdcF family protein [Chitinophagaceae bacterium]|nr:YdcF family protein [Chitinophagaceae bacterium]